MSSLDIRVPLACRLVKAFAEVPQPSGAIHVRYSSSHQGRHGLVQAAYELPWTLEELRRFYGTHLSSKGWQYAGIVEESDWGRDLGVRKAVWLLPPFRATVTFVRPQRAAYGGTTCFPFPGGFGRAAARAPHHRTNRLAL